MLKKKFWFILLVIIGCLFLILLTQNYTHLIIIKNNTSSVVHAVVKVNNDVIQEYNLAPSDHEHLKVNHHHYEEGILSVTVPFQNGVLDAGVYFTSSVETEIFTIHEHHIATYTAPMMTCDFDEISFWCRVQLFAYFLKSGVRMTVTSLLSF